MKRAADIIYECMKEKKITQTQLATELDEDVRAINQQLKRYGDLKVSRFADLLEHMGYRIEIVDSGVKKVSAITRDKLEDDACECAFYTVYGDSYIGVKNSSSGLAIEEFSDFDKCKEWLEG